MSLPSGFKTFKCADPNNQYTLTKEEEFAYANYGSVIALCGFQFAQTAVNDASSNSIRNWFQSAAQVVDNAAAFGLAELGSSGTPSYLKVVDTTDDSIAAVVKISNQTGRKSVVTDNPGFVDAYNSNPSKPTGFNGGLVTPAGNRASVETGNFTKSTAVASSDNSRGDLVHGSTAFVPGRSYAFSWHATDPSPVWTASYISMYEVDQTRLTWRISSDLALSSYPTSPTVIVKNNADNSTFTNFALDNLTIETGEYVIGISNLTAGTSYSITVTVEGYQGSLSLSATTLSSSSVQPPTFTAAATGSDSAEVLITAPTVPAGYTLLGYEVGSKMVQVGIADTTPYTFGSLVSPTAGQTTATLSGLTANKTYAVVVRAKYGPTQEVYSSNATVQYIYTAASVASSPLSDVLASAVPGNTNQVNGGASAVSQLMQNMIAEKAKAAPAGVFELVADGEGSNPTPSQFISAMGKSGVLNASDYAESYLSSPPLTAGGAVNGDAVVRPDMMNTAGGAALLYAARTGATYILRSGTSGVGAEIGRLIVGSDGSLSARDATNQVIQGVTSSGVTTYTVGNRNYTAVASGSLYIKVTGNIASSGITSTSSSLSFTIAEQGSTAIPASSTVTAWAAKTAGTTSSTAGVVPGAYNASTGAVTFIGLDPNTLYYMNVRTTGSGNLAETSWHTAPLLVASAQSATEALLLWATFSKPGSFTYAVNYNVVGQSGASAPLTPLTQNGYDSGVVQPLASGGTYRFNVVITDSSSNTYTTNDTFATLGADQGYTIPSTGSGSVQLNPLNGSTAYKYGTGTTQRQALFNMVGSSSTYTSGQTVSLFPNGDTYVAMGTFSAASGAIVGAPTTQLVTNNQQNNPAICFLADAPVLTPAGYRPISSIAVGDLVRTAAGRDVAVKRVFAKEYQANASVNPYVIPKGSFGAQRALPISPNHEVMTARGMVKARDLGLKRMKMAGSFTYYNLELEDWVRDNLVVAGVECESLAPAKRVTMTKAEFGRFVAARYGPAAAARLRTVCFEEVGGRVSMPAFA